LVAVLLLLVLSLLLLLQELQAACAGGAGAAAAVQQLCLQLMEALISEFSMATASALGLPWEYHDTCRWVGLAVGGVVEQGMRGGRWMEQLLSTKCTWQRVGTGASLREATGSGGQLQATA
jgi:hypothetical protein